MLNVQHFVTQNQNYDSRRPHSAFRYNLMSKIEYNYPKDWQYAKNIIENLNIFCHFCLFPKKINSSFC